VKPCRACAYLLIFFFTSLHLFDTVTVHERAVVVAALRAASLELEWTRRPYAPPASNVLFDSPCSFACLSRDVHPIYLVIL
jgi:hypothetical protein